MRRPVAILWHASFVILAGLLYFFFVLPRWNELTGDWSHTLGTAMRIVCGVLIALSTLPVLLTLQRTSKPEYNTPQLALSLRTWSVALHILGGVLITGAAISEIWLTLDNAGTWLFGIYGAAGGVTLLAALAFYLAFLAELPPPPPKPLKAKSTTRGRGRKSDEPTDSAAADEVDDDTTSDSESEIGNTEGAESEESVEEAPTDEETTTADSGDAPESKLRNRRSGKGSGPFGRSRGGVSLD
ncbi:hypothetical protein [Mycobacterium sp. OTB74]|uniref:hypothetical protein n=1 Tax=Mycobacterium sp. OTB74 TaxID=1853452 RepID=UPI002476B9A1|nr:hypothetical protein [Mycobacterium sp. OTB74]MDH6243550.1 hypothetical protein [Mycobacterium sp. OTB74]